MSSAVAKNEDGSNEIILKLGKNNGFSFDYFIYFNRNLIRNLTVD
jgi:hypothetical protein